MARGRDSAKIHSVYNYLARPSMVHIGNESIFLHLVQAMGKWKPRLI